MCGKTALRLSPSLRSGTNIFWSTRYTRSRVLTCTGICMPPSLSRCSVRCHGWDGRSKLRAVAAILFRALSRARQKYSSYIIRLTPEEASTFQALRLGPDCSIDRLQHQIDVHTPGRLRQHYMVPGTAVLWNPVEPYQVPGTWYFMIHSLSEKKHRDTNFIIGAKWQGVLAEPYLIAYT